MSNLLFGALLSVASLQAQDISGVWQGTLGEGPRKIRFVVRIAKGESATKPWTGTFFSIDQSPDWWAGGTLESITLEGRAIQFKLQNAAANGSFEGTLDPDGASITGTWMQRSSRRPLVLQRATPETEWKHASTHSTQFVTVDRDVKLEVLDWGGSGRPVLLLAGGGNTAHVYDSLATKLAASYHVYGLTRRGFGLSSAPPSGYGPDRLADDVLEVIDFLKINKPILIGHSIAGQELSSIGSRHPDKVAGLIYVDAGASFAYYDETVGDNFANMDLGVFPPLIRKMLEGRQKYTRIQGAVLAMFALKGYAPAEVEPQISAFEKGVPGARVLRFPKLGHYIFVEDEALALREITAFIATLP
jgi:pimeloyl-ACP methyl ester carboxylesterase